MNNQTFVSPPYCHTVTVGPAKPQHPPLEVLCHLYYYLCPHVNVNVVSKLLLLFLSDLFLIKPPIVHELHSEDNVYSFRVVIPIVEAGVFESMEYWLYCRYLILSVS